MSKLKVLGGVLAAIVGLHVFLFLFMLYFNAYMEVMMHGDTLRITNFFACSALVLVIVFAGIVLEASKGCRAWMCALNWLERCMGAYVVLAAYGCIYGAVLLGGYMRQRGGDLDINSMTSTVVKVAWAYFLYVWIYATCALGVPAEIYRRRRATKTPVESKGSPSEKPQCDNEAYERMA